MYGETEVEACKLPKGPQRGGGRGACPGAETSVRRAPQSLVVIPTYNEAENVGRLIPAVLAAAPLAEILIVDDSSPDGTGSRAEGMASQDSRIHVVSRPEKSGLGSAYRDGFCWALDRGYEWIVQMDADFSHDPAMVEVLFWAAERFDLVVGSRYCCGGRLSENWPRRRRLLSSSANLYARSLLRTEIRDMTGGFKCWRRWVLEQIDLSAICCQGYGFQVEMNLAAVGLGARILELPITFADREKGESKLGWAQAWEAARKVPLLAWRWRTRRRKAGGRATGSAIPAPDDGREVAGRGSPNVSERTA